jgi:hypothetical protein
MQETTHKLPSRPAPQNLKEEQCPARDGSDIAAKFGSGRRAIPGLRQQPRKQPKGNFRSLNRRIADLGVAEARAPDD